jgi:Ca2+-binding EF-hand superfamily protein
MEVDWTDFLFSEASKYVGRKRILVRFGKQEREIIVKPGSELITVEIHPMLSLEQQSALDMRYLRNVDSGAAVEFVRETGSPYKSIQNDELENFGVYELVVSDLRASRISSLPAEVIENVRKEFTEYDPFSQGFATLESIEKHFAVKLESDRVSNEAKRLTADELDYFLTQRAEQYDAQMRQFRAMDINSDDRVSLEEYLIKASNNVEKYIDVNFKITCGTKEYPLRYRMNSEVKLSELKLLVGGHSPIHQQFWRYLHLMCRTDNNFSVVFLDRDKTNKDAFVLKVVKLRDGHIYEMVREDLRQTASKLLSVEQIEDARRRFDAIDHDRSGIIEVKDAEALFAKKSQDAMEKAYKELAGEPEKLEYSAFRLNF